MAENEAAAAEEQPDILEQIRRKDPLYRRYDDESLARAIGERYPEYRPYLRPYLKLYDQPEDVVSGGSSELRSQMEASELKSWAEASPFGPLQKPNRPIKEFLTGPKAQEFYESLAPGGDAADPRARLAKNVMKGGAEFASSQVTPMNALIGGGLKTLPESLGKAASGAFFYMMGKTAVERAPEAYRAFREGRYDDAVKLATEMGLTAVAAYFAGKHAVKDVVSFNRGAMETQAAQAPPPAPQEPLSVTAEEMATAPPPPPPAPPRGQWPSEEARQAQRQPQGPMPQQPQPPPPGLESLTLEENPLDRLSLEGLAPESTASNVKAYEVERHGRAADPSAVAHLLQIETQRGYIEPSDVPEEMAFKIQGEGDLERLLGEITSDRAFFMGKKTLMPESYPGQPTSERMLGVKSPVPPPLQGRYDSFDELADTLRKGLKGDQLSPARQKLFDDFYEFYTKDRYYARHTERATKDRFRRNFKPVEGYGAERNLTDEDIEDYAQSHGFDIKTKRIFEANQPPPEEQGSTDFDPVELEREIQAQRAQAQHEAADSFEEAFGADHEVTQAAREDAKAIDDLRGAMEPPHEPAPPPQPPEPAPPPPEQPPVVKNPPADPEVQGDLDVELELRGVDHADPDAVAEELSKYGDNGKPSKPIKTTTGQVEVSKATEYPDHYQADLAEGESSEVAHELDHVAEAEAGAEPGSQTPEGPGANNAIVNRTLDRMGNPGGRGGPFAREAITVNRHLLRTAEEMEQTETQRRLMNEGIERMAQRSNLGRDVQAQVAREGMAPEEGKNGTFSLRISRADISNLTARWIDAARTAADFSRKLDAYADVGARNTAKMLRRNAEDIAKQVRAMKTAWARMGHQFQMPPELIQYAKEAARYALQLREAKLRRPIYTNILESLRNWKELDPGEKKQLWRNTVDAFRLNLFSVTSFSLDAIANLSELGGQVARAAGYDLAQISKGQVFPNLRGFMYALLSEDRATGKMLHPDIREALGHTTGGELIPGFTTEGYGTFTTRGLPEGPEGSPLKQAIEGRGGRYTPPPGPGALGPRIASAVSKGLDYAVGSPLYFKGTMDAAAANFAANAALYAEAVKATPKEMTPMQARAFREQFVDNPTPEAKALAIKHGNEAKFNRPLSDLSENIAGSTLYRLTGDVFARWQFQFPKWMGEMVGVDPVAWKNIFKKGGIDGEALAGYAAKSLTGLGGMYFLYKHYYDNVDFQSMEYVSPEDGKRTRLSGREPLTTAFSFLALYRAVATQSQADLEKFRASWQFASIPFVHLYSGEGGLLTSVLKNAVTAQKNAKMDARALQRDMVDFINRSIPGQALLSGLKTLFDDTVREGFGGKLPGVSLTLPAAPQSTTGQELRPKQSLPGTGPFRQIGGVPIPGAKRELDPVDALLRRYVGTIYRGPRASLVGVPASDLPDEFRREYEHELGYARLAILGPLAHRLAMQGESLAQLDKKIAKNGRPVSENLVRRLDLKASRLAAGIVRTRHNLTGRPEREPSLRQMVGPAGILKEVEAAKAQQKAEAEGGLE